MNALQEKTNRPAFRDLLTPEQRTAIDAMSELEQKAFLRALAMSLAVRELPKAT